MNWENACRLRNFFSNRQWPIETNAWDFEQKATKGTKSDAGSGKQQGTVKLLG